MNAAEGEASNKYILCNVQLSKIISFDSVQRTISERTTGTLLRPIVIDGPLIGMSYDQKYALDDRISSCKNYVRRPKLFRDSDKMNAYPIQALVKILFHFIARGHKATAFMPIFFNERLDETCNSCTVVSDVEQFRELVRLKLIKFLPGENFASHLKHRTAKCQGILVTSQEAFYFNNACIARKGDHSNVNALSTDTSCDLMYSTVIPEMLIDKGKLPVIIPLFRPYNRRLIISLDVIRWRKILEVEEREVPVAQYNKLLSEEQLTLQAQLELLSKLATMMNDEFPCGRQDAKIVPLIEHAFALTQSSSVIDSGAASLNNLDRSVSSSEFVPNFQNNFINSDLVTF